MVTVNKLIVVAGPPEVGKSFFMGKIRDPAASAIWEQLQMGQVDTWHFLHARHLDAPTHRRKHQRIEGLLLHYDTVRIRRKNLDKYDQDRSLSVLTHALEITFLTLWARPEVLLQRLARKKEQLLTGWMRFIVTKKRLGHLEQLRQLYGSPQELAAHYQGWLEFCSRFDAVGHWASDHSKGIPTLTPVDGLLDRLAEENEPRSTRSSGPGAEQPPS